VTDLLHTRAIGAQDDRADATIDLNPTAPTRAAISAPRSAPGRPPRIC
jgi:hypothetical protein